MITIKNSKLISAAIGVLSFLMLDCFAMKTEVSVEPTRMQYNVRATNVRQLHFSEIDSIQTWSKENVKMSYPADDNVYVLVTAGRQTAGIGTHNRKWLSHIPGNVYASLSFLIPSPHESTPDGVQKKVKPFPQLSALAVYKTLEEILGGSDRLKVKWPNDVMVDEKKYLAPWLLV